MCKKDGRIKERQIKREEGKKRLIKRETRKQERLIKKEKGKKKG
jgi:hypothetical protein